MTAHAKLSPSGAHRWLECPGSIEANADKPWEQNIYALEGTTAHALLETCLRLDSDPEEFLGYELHKASIGFLSIFGGVFLALGLAVTHEAVKEKIRDTEPGFVRAAYHKFKDKTCFYIKFK